MVCPARARGGRGPLTRQVVQTLHRHGWAVAAVLLAARHMLCTQPCQLCPQHYCHRFLAAENPPDVTADDHCRVFIKA